MGSNRDRLGIPALILTLSQKPTRRFYGSVVREWSDIIAVSESMLGSFPSHDFEPYFLLTHLT